MRYLFTHLFDLMLVISRYLRGNYVCATPNWGTTRFFRNVVAVALLLCMGTGRVLAVDYCQSSAFGYGASATGGGSATPVLVSTVDQLKSALNKASNKVIIITSNLTFTTMLSVQDGSNITLMGLPGVTLTNLDQTSSNSGILFFKRYSNVIIRNLTFIGPGAYDCDGNDLLCFENVTTAWVDHCDFQDGCDGNFDNKAKTDNVTVSWCRFRYLKDPKPGGLETDDHRFTNLLGKSSSDKPADGTYNFTWAYCWWDNGCKERMVRCRNASLHFLNCYWNSSVANYYIGPENVDAYVEGCYIDGKPASNKIFYQNYGGTNGVKFINCYAAKGVPSNVSNRSVLTPSYGYTALSATDARTMVTNASCGAGATLTVTTAGVVSSTCDGGVAPTIYTVTWDATTNGGSCGTSSTLVESGQAIGTLPTATKSGYTFDGWFTASSGGTQINASTTVSGNITYYAQFTEISGGGGGGNCYEWAGTPSSLTDGSMTVSTNLLLTAGAGASIDAAAVWSGSGNKTIFKIDGSSKYMEGHLIDNSDIASVTISAATNQSSAKNYVIVFSPNSAFTTGLTINTHSAPSKDDARDDSKLVHEFTAPSGTKYFRVYRKFTYDATDYGDNQTIRVYGIEVCKAGSSPTYTLSYDENGGSGSAMADQVGTSLTVATNTYTAPTGYSFQKWNTAMNGGGTDYAAGGSITLTEDVTLYAIWQPQTYTVTLNQGSGSGGTANVTATFDDAMPSITVPSRSGYTFAGYFTGANGTGTQYYDENGSSTNDWTIASNTTLYAYWIEGSAPEPTGCNLHFWFFYAADATSNGLSNDATVFTSMVSDGSSQAGSITIDGTSYSVTRRTGDPGTGVFGSFTIPSNKIGTFYALAVSSGAGDRQINLVCGGTTYELPVEGGSSTYKRLEQGNLPAGTYSIQRDGTSNVRLGVVVVKLCDDVPCPSAYSFHYGPHTGDWETPICFEQVGETHEWQITNFAIPSHASGEFYVGWQGSTNGQSETKAWSDSYSDGNGAMKLLPTSSSIVGQAIGAVGTISIWDNSGWLNQNVGFTPNGYGITYGGVGHAFNITATANMLETDVVTLPNVSTTYTMGLATATAGTYVACAHSSAAEAISNIGVTILEGGKKKILLAPGSFNDAGAVYAVWDGTNSAWGDGTTKLFTDADGDGVWECPVASSCTSINLVRMSSGTTASNVDWSRKWNQTANITVGDLLNKYTITSLSGDNCAYTTTAIHPATGDKGKFRMWANSADNNWFVHWIPYYVLSYDGNGGTGSTAQTERNSESSTLTVTTAANGFTAPTGYEFAGWAISQAHADAGTVDYAAGASYTLTSNATLYAVWSPITYSITLNKGDHGATNQSATVAYDALALTSITHVTPNTGYTRTGYYDGETKVLNADGTFAASNVTGYITSDRWSKADDCTLTAKWEAKTITITINANTANHGSTTPGTVTATYGSVLPAFTAASGESGYDLTGYWTAATDGTMIINADGTLVRNTAYSTDESTPKWNSEVAELTLYAQYEEVETPCFMMVANSSAGSDATLTSVEDIEQGKKNCSTLSGGTAKYSYRNASSKTMTVKKPNASGQQYGWQFGSNNDTIVITLIGAKLQEGSLISISGNGSSAVGLKFNGITTVTNTTGSSGNWSGTYTVKSTDTAIKDKHEFNVTRASGSNTYIYSITIANCADRTSYDITNGDPSHGTIAITDGSSAITSAEENATVHISATPADGYSFDSWNVTKDASGDPVSVATSSSTNPTTFTMPAEAVTVDATFTPNTYTITYNLNGASWAGGYSAPSSYTVGTGATLPVVSNMTNVGYTFGGWYANSGLTGAAVTSVSTSDYGNKEFWAKWTENTYTITYNKNNGSATGSTTSTVGHYVTVADNGFTFTDHVFNGWNTEPDGSGDNYNEGEEVELTADMTLYAQWGAVVTATWSVTKIDDKLYRGGGGYSVTVYLDQADWDASGDKDDLELTATDGVVLSNVTKTINGAGKAQITADFAITTDVAADATEITFTLSVPTAGDYAAAELEHSEDLTSCGGGMPSIIFTFTVADIGDDVTVARNGGDVSLTTSNHLAALSGGTVNLHNYNTNSGSAQKMIGSDSKNNVTERHIRYAANENVVILRLNTALAVGDTIVITSNNTDEVAITRTSTRSDATDSCTSSNKYIITAGHKLIGATTLYVWRKGSSAYIKTFSIKRPSTGSDPVLPTLTWETDLSGGVEKETGDPDFTHTASTTSNTLGSITYSSSNTSVATVNATTGKVHIAGAAGEATITATLAASGCYEEATVSYNITVTRDCDDVAGTISTNNLGCEGIEMTVTGYTSTGSETFQWYKDGVSLGGGYTAAKCTVTVAGEYYVVVDNTTAGARHCDMASTNTVVVAATGVATASKIVDSWYVKNGRRTPDVALVTTTNALNFKVENGSSTVIWHSNGSVTTGFGGCGFRMDEDGTIYLCGTTAAGGAPTGLSAGDETLTITAIGCGGSDSKSITIHCQAATARPSIAFVVDRNKIGGSFDDEDESHSVNTALFKFLDYGSDSQGAFDLTGQNIYSTTDEKSIREHYSQFDAILITDDPNTKKVPKGVSGDKAYKTKGYVNAFGTMIDVRPILTMEAYVSALANWSCVKGDPKSPNPRQYEMRLQCKDHEIYSGLPAPAAGTHVWEETIDGEIYRHVIMVDSAKSPYNDFAYNSKTDSLPALQGFASEAMGNLLGLGLIHKDSLHAGVERQEEPAARMMILGINNKALPNALTDEGKKVIENALTYLLKTNMEDVDDCSNFFVGGDGSKPRDWNTLANWAKGTLPNYETKVRILAPCELSDNAVKVAQVDIATSGTSKYKPSCNGSLTIEPTGALIVGGKIRTAEAPHFANNDLKPTIPENLVLNTDASNQSALILDNSDGATQATVNLYSLGRKIEGNNQFQYMAVPMNYVPVDPFFANENYPGKKIYTYVWHENGGWERRGYYTDLYAFEAVGLTTTSTSAMEYTITGNLASTAKKEITLTHESAATYGSNIIGNSWTAPIDIASLKDAIGDDSKVQKTVYIYCTGKDVAPLSGSADETPGQWLAVPIDASGWSGWTGLKAIPAMQAFLIRVSSETSLTLNYDKVVRTTATANLNVPLRAPRRMSNEEEITLTTLHVEDSQTSADLYLFEGDQFSDAFDNGWEASYMGVDGRSAQLYAMASDGKMAVLAAPELEGTQVGFMPGKETMYTFSFTGGNGAYYLNDIKAQKSTLIQEGNTYSFEYESDDDANRFYISRTAIDAPAIETGVGNTDLTPKVLKFIYQDKLYILRNGVLYDATGKVVK